MKAIVFTVLLTACCMAGRAQQPVAAAKAKEAFLITRMVAQLHVQPRPLDTALSNDLYLSVLDELDEDRLLFTAADIQQLSSYRYHLHTAIAQQNTDFLNLLEALYNTRIHQADTIIGSICSQPFHFNTAEQLTVAEDTSYPADIAAMRSKWYKELKLSVLNDIVNKLAAAHVTDLQLAQQKADSLEPACRKKAALSFQRSLQHFLSAPHGLTDAIGNIYCKALANCYDPHTEYFPLSEKENFDSELGQKRYRFGFQLKENESGEVFIANLVPGSPAFRCGLLNIGDKLQEMQWQGEQPINIAQAGVDEISTLLSSSNHDQLHLTVKKTDGSLRQVVLTKEIADDDEEEEDKVKNFLLKGSKNIGYISLPAFYTSWDSTATSEDGGCASDVTKAILKLKKEHIDGLILDLRYNGGGSLQEAVALAGIFIDAGPVLQVKRRDIDAAYTMRDINRGTVYDGPLLVLVNGYSASASEILAGTLQDYHRAIIAGSTTYGKATGQIMWPLDTVLLAHPEQPTQATSYLKLTTERLYRITGKAAQFNGVTPDIVLPDLTSYSEEKEKNEPFALHSSAIAANKYYRPYAALPLARLQQAAPAIMNRYPYFKAVQRYGEYLQAGRQHADTSLLLADALQKKQQLTDLQNALTAGKNIAHPAFKVENDRLDAGSITTGSIGADVNETAKKYLLADPYIHFAYALLSE